MTDRELMQQALDYIIETNRISSFQLVPASRSNQVITALRDRLAQPEQEPVAWYVRFDNGRVDLLAVPVSSARRAMWESAGKRFTVTPLYIAPRQWQRLTDDEIDRVTDQQWATNNNKPIYAAHKAYARAIEAKLKEKNNAR